jgi:hypothetical protein
MTGGWSLRGATLTAAVCFVVSACATSTPSTRGLSYPNRSREDLFNHVVKALSVGGYEIKSRDESAGVVQALRPMTGAFSRPSYGHKVTIAIESSRIGVTVFPAGGVVGGPSVEDIQNEIVRLLGGA